MTHPKHRKCCIAALAFAVHCYVVSLNAQAPNDAADVARLVEILNLHEGSVVADIGAGAGPLTVGISPHVGGSGRVYSTDLEPARLAEIREAADRTGLHNITVIEGQPTGTNLPASSCDGIFMRDVYHHFAQPPEMNASLYRSLKPGGHLAVIDFPPRSGRTAPPGSRDNGANHGILPDDLVRELSAVGFADVQQVPWSSPGYFAVVGRKP
jgi:ubiquinone/menaquinone biosynthesis C-methylase UbiE